MKTSSSSSVPTGRLTGNISRTRSVLKLKKVHFIRLCFPPDVWAASSETLLQSAAWGGFSSQRSQFHLQVTPKQERKKVHGRPKLCRLLFYCCSHRQTFGAGLKQKTERHILTLRVSHGLMQATSRLGKPSACDYSGFQVRQKERDVPILFKALSARV